MPNIIVYGGRGKKERGGREEKSKEGEKTHREADTHKHTFGALGAFKAASVRSSYPKSVSMNFEIPEFTNKK